MGLLDFVRSRITKSVRQARGWSWSTASEQTDFEITDDYRGYEKAYREQVWVRRAINLIADEIASIPLKLYRGIEEGKEEVKNHPILDLLADVNPLTMNYSDLLKATSIARRIYGIAYWYLERKGGKVPKEIFWLRPSMVEIKTDPKKYITAIEYSPEGTTKIIYNPQDVIIFKFFNPLDEYYGLSPISAIRGAVSSDLYAQAWNRYFFKNYAVADGFIAFKEHLTKEQRENVELSLKAKYGGAKQAHKIGVLEGGAVFQATSTTPKDAEWSQLRDKVREEIGAIFGVPPTLLGSPSANYATAMTEKKSLWQETILPELSYFAEVLNWTLVRQFEEKGLGLAFDTTEISALQEEISTKHDRLREDVKAGILTPNEARDELGKEKKPGGDKVYLPATYLPMGGE